MTNQPFSFVGPERANEREGSTPPAAPAVGAVDLPCLNSNNSTEQVEGGKHDRKQQHNRFQSNHRKSVKVLMLEVQNLVQKYGINYVGFLTLTFADDVQDIKEAQRRFNSLNTHVLRHRYAKAISCVERQKSGRVHFHLLVVLDSDIRTGVIFEEFARGFYGSAGVKLKKEWAFWRETAPNYGFGRTELLPIKSSSEGIAKYVGKYIAKHVDSRLKEDKGARLVRYAGYSSGDRCASVRFAWHSPGASLWRLKLEKFCDFYGYLIDDLPLIFGPKWAFKLQDMIMNFNLRRMGEVSYSRPAVALLDGAITLEEFWEMDLAPVVVSREVERDRQWRPRACMDDLPVEYLPLKDKRRLPSVRGSTASDYPQAPAFHWECEPTYTFKPKYLVE